VAWSTLAEGGPEAAAAAVVRAALAKDPSDNVTAVVIDLHIGRSLK
jgi:serine/threonine protein phosphatase PrpC